MTISNRSLDKASKGYRSDIKIRGLESFDPTAEIFSFQPCNFCAPALPRFCKMNFTI